MPTAHVNVKGRTSMDGSGWAAGLRKMETSTKAAAGRMAGSLGGMFAGVFAVGYLRQATMRMIDHGDAIDKMAKRMESTTDTAQRFDFAASQNGATIQEIEKAFMRTAASMEGAKQGLTTQMRAFQAFGITLQQIKTSTPEEIFLKIAEAIEKAGGALDKAKSLQDIMGRGGRQLVPAFVSGFAATAAAAPDPIEKETIQKLAELKDAIDRLQRVLAKPAAELVTGTAGIIESWSRLFAARQEAFDELGKPGKGQFMSPGFWDKMWENFDRFYLEEVGGKGTTENFMPADPEFKRIRDRMRQEQEAWRNDATASTLENWMGFRKTKPEETATAFVRPSMQLNSLQRIGAAVTQSADPIAIEKDNNKLLQNIARNTKKTADAAEEF